MDDLKLRRNLVGDSMISKSRWFTDSILYHMHAVLLGIDIWRDITWVHHLIIIIEQTYLKALNL